MADAVAADARRVAAYRALVAELGEIERLAAEQGLAGVAAACCLSLTLYPYVYLLARQAFGTQGIASLEVAQSLGMSRARGFRRVALPLARPWLAAGVALVCMDTMADFGTVKVFNFDTYTTAIYGAWFALFSLSDA